MSTPQENFETATDEDASHDERQVAIEALVAANDCSRLVEMVRSDDVADEYRQRAVSALATPECKETLVTMVEEEALPTALERQVASVLEDVPDDVGSGS